MSNNIEIQFNTNIVKKLKALNFQSDQLGSILFILFSLYENKIDLLDEFDDFSKQRRALFLYRELELKGLIVFNEPETEKVMYSLTTDGIALVEFIKLEFKNINKTEVSTEKIAVVGVEQLTDKVKFEEEDVESWIDEWLDIFPRGIKSGGKLVRSDKLSCIRKMKVFLREYEYSKDTIMGATRAYVKYKEAEGWTFMRCAVYFIYRIEKNHSDKISDLAGECEQFLYDRDRKGSSSSSTENNLEFMA